MYKAPQKSSNIVLQSMESSLKSMLVPLRDSDLLRMLSQKHQGPKSAIWTSHLSHLPATREAISCIYSKLATGGLFSLEIPYSLEELACSWKEMEPRWLRTSTGWGSSLMTPWSMMDMSTHWTTWNGAQEWNQRNITHSTESMLPGLYNKEGKDFPLPLARLVKKS